MLIAIPTNKDISNIKGAEKIEHLDGLNPTQAFIRDLQGNGYFNDCWLSEYRLSEENTNAGRSLTGVVLVNKVTLQYARRYNSVYLSDSTFKTNRYGWILHHIGGFTAQSRSIAFAFILLPEDRQKQLDYIWGMQKVKDMIFTDEHPVPGCWMTDRELAVNLALKEVFPTTNLMLCTWHIDKCIETQARKLSIVATEDDLKQFMEMWKTLRSSESIEIFTENLNLFKATYPRQELIAYLEKEWLPYAKHFANFSTDRVRHLGTYVDSRIESMHHVMKGYGLVNDKAGFDELTRGLSQYCAQQVSQVAYHEGVDSLQPKKKFLEIPIFADVVKLVSSTALELVYKEYTIAIESLTNNTSLSPCSGKYDVIMGLHCKHKCKKAIETKKTLSLSDFYQHWQNISRAAQPLSSDIPKILPVLSKRKRKKSVQQGVAQVKNDIKRSTAPSGRTLSAHEIAQLQYPLVNN